MSKTDKTAPWFVKWFYEPTYLEEVHRHEFHDCDLPPKPTPHDYQRYISWGGYRDDSCFWYPSLEFYRSKDASCSCDLCGYDAYSSVPLRKRQRIDGRDYCRDGWRDEY